VADVEQFPGHIACDGASRSEVVVPIVQAGKVRYGHPSDLLFVYKQAMVKRERRLLVTQTVAIIDIDCAELDGFTLEDQEGLEELAELLALSCDF
jgi:L-methionine (R)-S-oxide reductase